MKIRTPFNFFDAIYCINLDARKDRWQRVKKELRKLGIGEKVLRFSAIEVRENGHIGIALSVRKIIEIAKINNYKNVLVLEDDIRLENFQEFDFQESVFQLKNTPWDLFYLGGSYDKKEFSFFLKKSKLFRAGGIGCGHAIAYNKTIYQTILRILPDDRKKMSIFIDKYKSFDHYFVRMLQWRIKTYTPSHLFCTQEPDRSNIVGKFSSTAYEKNITTKVLRRRKHVQIFFFVLHHLMIPVWYIKFSLRALRKKILRKISSTNRV